MQFASSLRFFLLLAALGLVVGFPGCAVNRNRPPTTTLAIYVTQYDMASLAAQASAVRQRRVTEPALWLVTGGFLDDSPTDRLGAASRAQRLLDAAGVDAVLLTPGWLALGRPVLDRFLAEAHFYVLGANLVDSSGRTLGHELMVKKAGSARVGVAGIWLDSVNVRSTAARFIAPDFATRRIEPVLRQRADVVGLLVGPRGSVDGWGVDFVAGTDAGRALSALPSSAAGRIRRINARLSGGVLTNLTSTEQDISGLVPDSLVLWTMDSIRSAGVRKTEGK